MKPLDERNRKKSRCCEQICFIFISSEHEEKSRKLSTRDQYSKDTMCINPQKASCSLSGIINNVSDVEYRKMQRC